MCTVKLAGLERKYKYFNNIAIFTDHIDIYDFNNKLIMTLPQEGQNRKEFEKFAFKVLNSMNTLVALLNW